MHGAGIGLSIAGAALGVVAAAWLLFGFSETNPRYVDDGMLYPGAQKSKVVPNLLRDQRKVSAVMVLGAVLQLLGVTLLSA